MRSDSSADREKCGHMLGVGLLAALMLLSAGSLSSCNWGQMGSSRAAPEIVLTPSDESGLKALLQKSKGQVVVLNFWATWCEPCRDEFPDLLKFYGNYRQKGLRLVLFSMDEPDQSQVIKKFLREEGVDFESYVRSQGDFESFVNSVDPTWIGGIPATFIFDRQGNRIELLVGQQKYETLEAIVGSLL